MHTNVEDIVRLYRLGYSTCEIADMFGVDDETIRQRLIRRGVKRRDYRKAMYMKSLRSTWWKDRKNLAYIVGAILGDGCVTSSGKGKVIQLIVKDREFRDSVANALRSIGLHPHSDKVKDSYRMRVFCPSLHHFMSRLKKSPKRLISLLKTSEEKIAFLKGFYEAEGTLCSTGHGFRLGLSNCNKWLIDICYNILKDLGFHPWLSQDDAYRVFLTRKREISTFLSQVNPCIKAKTIRGG